MPVNETNTQNLERLLNAGLATDEDLAVLNMASIDGNMNLETADVENLPTFQGTPEVVAEKAGQYIKVRDEYIETKRKWPGNFEKACETATLFQGTNSLIDLLTSCNNKAGLLYIAEDSNRDEDVREAAIDALANLGATEYTDKLLSLFGKTEDDRFHDIDKAIITFLGKTRATEQADFLLGIVKGSEIFITTEALEALIEIRAYEQIAKSIESGEISRLGNMSYLMETLQLITHNNVTYFKPSLKIATRNFLNNLSESDREELHTGNSYFANDPYQIFKKLMNAIGSIADESDIEYFTDLIENNNLGDHGNAAVLDAITAIGTRKALDKVWLMAYKLKGSRASAQKAIATSIINAYEKYGNAETDKYRFAKLIIENHKTIDIENLKTAIDTLKKWGAAEEIWELGLQLRNKYPTSEYAFRALAELNMPRLASRVRNKIATQLLNNNGASWEIWLLGKIGGKKEAEFLRTELFLMKDFSNKREAILALKNLGSKEDLLAVVTSPDIELFHRNLAVEALTQLEASTELHQIANNEELPEKFRLVASEAL